MKKIKVAVVGTGFIGPAHIEALRRLPNVEVLGLCEANIDLANNFVSNDNGNSFMFFNSLFIFLFFLIGIVLVHKF